MSRTGFTAVFLSLACLAALTSCIRDAIPDCPPLRVNIAVKDKNYFNVDRVELEDRRQEDLPFREYVPTIHWVLRDAETGAVVDKSPVHTVSGDEKMVSADINPDIAHGRYVLTVWGGIESEQALSEDNTQITLHRGHAERNDVYMTNDTLLYDYLHNDYTVELERTKGKLIIENLNLPPQLNQTDKEITKLFAQVDNEFKYDGEAEVDKSAPLDPSGRTVTKTLLTPSVGEDGSLLNITFLVTNGTRTDDEYRTPDVSIMMRRNELTVLRYFWSETNRGFDIYMLVNDNWEQIHKMDID